MSTGGAPSLDLAVQISDLSSASQLKSLLQGDAKPIFQFAAETGPYWSGPVEKMPSGTKLSFNLSQDANWKTSTGIGFGLSGSAECDLEIVSKGCVIEYLDNLDNSSKANLPAGDYNGSVYLKLSLSFTIAGNVSGAGGIGALGISGNAKASAGASFVFAHTVKCGTLVKDAITESFDKFVFPFEPSCALNLAVGDLAQVDFNGCMSFNLQLSYGLGDYNFCAPSVTTVLNSCSRAGVDLSLPKDPVELGASANVGCTHSDDFTVIVQKLDANQAFLYLMRAKKTDVSGGGSLGAQINLGGSSGLKLDQQKLADAVNQITRGKGGAKVAGLCGDLEGKLNDKVSGWITGAMKNGATLKAAYDAQSNRTLILKYKIAVANTAVLDKSWDFFCVGNIQSAVGAGGLTLDPGSGICNQISHSLTVGVTFFNLFHAQDVNTYFQTSKVVVTPTGNVHFEFDVGDESDSTVNKALQKTRIHFIAEADANTTADVKLRIELSATNNKDEARHMIALPAYLPSGPQATSATSDMQQFVRAHPAGTLNLNFELESSVYGKLTCSPYDGAKPAVNQSVDAHNWQPFHDAAVKLLNLDFAAQVAYSVWQEWNKQSNGATGPNGIADRRHIGDPTAGSVVWQGQPWDVVNKLNYFCAASSSFMNLCDDLQQLAEIVGKARIPEDWNLLLGDLKDIVMRDVNTDYAKPATAAILQLVTPKTVSYDTQLCGNAFTGTISLM